MHQKPRPYRDIDERLSHAFQERDVDGYTCSLEQKKGRAFRKSLGPDTKDWRHKDPVDEINGSNGFAEESCREKHPVKSDKIDHV